MTRDDIEEYLEMQGAEFHEEGALTLREIILEVLSRIPEPDGIFLEHCTALQFFLCGSGQLVKAFPWFVRGDPDCVLLSSEFCRHPVEEAAWTVAHEIAHVVPRPHGAPIWELTSLRDASGSEMPMISRHAGAAGGPALP